nr:transposase [Pseudonocardia spinosispora]
MYDRPASVPDDLTDTQWAILEPLLPIPLSRSELGGRPEKHHRRTMLDAIFYVLDNGIKWRALPADFPPWSTVHGLFTRWHREHGPHDLLDALRTQLRRGLASPRGTGARPPPAANSPG